MVKRLTCPQGHHWDVDDPPAAISTSCPVCGSLANTLLAQEQPAAPGTPAEEESVPSTLQVPSDWIPLPKSKCFTLEIPGYEILSELGRGGAGVVYRARQIALDRIVALKVLASGPYAGPAERARFRSEAETVARLRHPNIVQIHEVGQADGRPFLVLEYLPGGSLADKLTGQPQPARQAGELTRTLARAVDCAHQHGILHRDLKPGNVLLDADGTPKVADFGLARRMEDEAAVLEQRLTPTGVILGTPSYMAPEQARGDVSQFGRGLDVYALGGILYEMLTGRPPFLGETLTDTLRQVVDAEPIPPRRLHPRTPRDLETICLRCLEKRPNRRYASAADLADDLQRFLDGKPIHARPVGRIERALKWARRRPAQAALLALIVIVPLLAIAGITAHAIQLQRKNEALADSHQRNIELLRISLQTESEFGNYVDDRLAPLPHLMGFREELLRDRLKYYQPILEKEPNDPEMRQTQAQALLAVGIIQQRLAHVEEAEQSYRQALDRLDRPVTKETPASRLLQARIHVQYGTLLTRLNRPDEAERHLQVGEQLLNQLVAESPSEENRRAQALACHNHAALRVKQRQFEAARQGYERAIALRRQLLQEHPESTTYPRELAGSYVNLAGLHLMQQQLPEARAELEHAEKVLQGQPQDPEIRNLVAGQRFNLALAERDTAPERADEGFRQALQLWSKLLEEFPAVPSYRRNTASAYFERAVLREKRKPREAVQPFRQSLALYRQLLNEWPNSSTYQNDVRDTLDHLADALYALKQTAEADELWWEQFALLEEMLSEQPSHRIWRQAMSLELAELGERDTRRGLVLVLRPPLALVPVAPPLAIALHDVANLSYGGAYLLRARAAFQRGLREERRLLREGPAESIYYAGLSRHAQGLGKLAWYLASYEDMRETTRATVEAAAGLAKDPNDHGNGYRSAAAGMALCAILTAKAGNLAPKEKTDRAEQHARQAVELLEKAVQAGYRDAADLERAPVFAPLRRRPDFQKLLRELKTKKY